MRKSEFRSYLEAQELIKSKDKAVTSRINRANIAEEILGESLDYIVADDDRMYNALNAIGTDSREYNGNIQNAVRWYYKFINKKSFPTLTAYRDSKNTFIIK